ncbi:MAG: type IV pilin N-terminal domain-containing protein [Thermoplasmatales archaeon]|nr:type IV pilin N-terminal domain-containing protein [Thermoplasmatales archaeon]
MGEQDLKGIYMEKEDAVSPVIATILMVAITVVLAATVYILVSHYTTGASTPLAATITEQSETSTSAILSLSYTTPASMSNPAGVTITISGGAVGSAVSFTGFKAGTFSVTSGVYTATIANPDGTTSVIESGATITITDSSAITWSGVTVTLTYTGYTGSATTTLP